MNAKQTRTPELKDSGQDKLKPQSAVPGKDGVMRVARATKNSLNGLREGVRSEAAITQEAVIFVIALPLSFFLAGTLWTWVALIASLLLVLAVEFLNTAIERLCNHIHPDKHEAIKATKDFASAGVFFALVLAGLVWGAATLRAFGVL